MNPELQKALVDLAAKLGVTVDHLWGVLLYQAKIEAAWEDTYLSPDPFPADSK